MTLKRIAKEVTPNIKRKAELTNDNFTKVLKSSLYVTSTAATRGIMTTKGKITMIQNRLINEGTKNLWKGPLRFLTSMIPATKRL